MEPLLIPLNINSMNIPIKEDDYKKLVDLQYQCGILESKFSDRCNYIVRTCASILKKKIDWWDFTNGSENNAGRFKAAQARNYDYVSFSGEGSFFGNDSVIILKNGGEWIFGNGEFPTRFLYEDFETEVSNGRQLYLERKQEKIKKESKKLLKKKKTAGVYEKAAKSLKKLSPEKLKELGLV
jgi:hypothetical protein